MSQQKRDAVKTKQTILQNAKKLFSQQGFNATSVNEIAEASNINKAMLYYYFKSKADIYEIVVQGILSDIYEKIITSDRCCDSATGDLRAFISIYARFASKHQYFPALMLRELSNSTRKLSDSVLDGCIKLFRLFNGILNRGIEEAIFQDVKPMVVFCMVISTINIMVVTTPFRQTVAQKADDIDTSSDISVDEMSEYIFNKILLMLGVRL